MISNSILEPYFYKNKKHEAYDITTKFYKDLKVHANGEFPDKEITERRPSESDNIKAYREKIWVAITKGEGVGLVINALGKIRRSSDWMVKFENEVPARIAEEETPESYFNDYYPYFASITNWAFSVLLKEYCMDANGLVLVCPMKEVAENEYRKPLPTVFNSDQIIEHNEEYAILLGNEKSYYNENTYKWQGNVYYVVTKEDITRYAETQDRQYVATFTIPNMLGYLPLVPTYGIYYDTLGKKNIYESRLQAMIPRLTEFVREYSDEQAEIVQHIHSEKYSFITQECKACEKTGWIKKGTKNVVCANCKGTGSVVSSPYNSTYAIRLPKTSMGEQPIPTPPVGYIQKSTEIAKLQDERLEKHMYKAFSAIAMQHLFQMPLNVSGFKKELDMDESITTVHNIAEDLVRIVDDVIRISIDWRYIDIIPNEEEREKLRPFIPVPEKFDIISTNYLMEEVGKAKAANLNPAIIGALEKEIAVKKFYTDPKKKDEILTILELDPLPNYSIEQKMTLNADGVISEMDYTISTYIQQFVQRAIREDMEFPSKPYDEKRVVLEGYANEVIGMEKKQDLEKVNGEPAKDSAANK